MDAGAIQTSGRKVDAVILLFPFTVKLKALIALTLPHATVMTPAICLVIAVMISLKLDVSVSHTACSLCTCVLICICQHFPSCKNLIPYAC